MTPEFKRWQNERFLWYHAEWLVEQGFKLIGAAVMFGAAAREISKGGRP